MPQIILIQLLKKEQISTIPVYSFVNGNEFALLPNFTITNKIETNKIKKNQDKMFANYNKQMTKIKKETLK